MGQAQTKNDLVKVRKPTGGPRPGSGRKKGTLNKRTQMLRKIADGALTKGHTPIDVMLKNMRRFDEEADGLWSEVMIAMGQMADTIKTSQEKFDFLDKMTATLGKMRECRLDAQKCAVDAAPFVHAKLSSVSVSVTDDKLSRKSEGAMTDEEKQDYFNKLRLRPVTDTPLSVTIDNETGEEVE